MKPVEEENANETTSLLDQSKTKKRKLKLKPIYIAILWSALSTTILVGVGLGVVHVIPSSWSFITWSVCIEIFVMLGILILSLFCVIKNNTNIPKVPLVCCTFIAVVLGLVSGQYYRRWYFAGYRSGLVNVNPQKLVDYSKIGGTNSFKKGSYIDTSRALSNYHSVGAGTVGNVPMIQRMYDCVAPIVASSETLQGATVEKPVDTLTGNNCCHQIYDGKKCTKWENANKSATALNKEYVPLSGILTNDEGGHLSSVIGFEDGKFTTEGTKGPTSPEVSLPPDPKVENASKDRSYTKQTAFIRIENNARDALAKDGRIALMISVIGGIVNIFIVAPLLTIIKKG